MSNPHERDSVIMRVEFNILRDRVLNALAKVGLSYRLFGGVAIAIHDPSRETHDIDFVLKKQMNDVNKLVEALVLCEFGARKDILDQIFGADPHEEMYLFALSRLRKN